MPPTFRLAHMNSYILRAPENLKMSTGIRQKKDILFCKRGGGLVSPLGPNVKILAQFSIEI